MPGDEIGQAAAEPAPCGADHIAFRAADIGNDRICREMTVDRGEHGFNRPDRNGNHDQIRAFYRARRIGLEAVDDAEFLLDRANRVVHVRSASRLGYSDLGKNRRRMEEIRRQFAPRGKRP